MKGGTASGGHRAGSTSWPQWDCASWCSGTGRPSARDDLPGYQWSKRSTANLQRCGRLRSRVDSTPDARRQYSRTHLPSQLASALLRRSTRRIGAPPLVPVGHDVLTTDVVGENQQVFALRQRNEISDAFDCVSNRVPTLSITTDHHGYREAHSWTQPGRVVETRSG